MSADNQQERPKHIPDDLGHYLSGFADGEGSFNISVKKTDYGSGWKIAVSFNISQRHPEIPKLYKQTLGCGTIRFRKDAVCYYEVRSIVDLNVKIREFFSQFPLRSQRQSFRLKCLLEVCEMMAKKEHLNPKGFRKALSIRDRMISNRPRKYNSTDVLKESSETIRQASVRKMI